MIETALTCRLNIEHPIILAPMATASGGRLAGAVSDAGGLGLIGGGYCDPDWIADEFAAAGNRPVGIGFITWALADRVADDPAFLSRIVERGPRAIFLSFGDPAPFAPAVREAGVPLVVQIQTLRDARRAVEVGADVVVAQGAEAGGHGERRATMTLVPEVADIVAASGTHTLVAAAGGIADGRGLAAALMLGASGVVMGSRLWAADEALVHPNMIDAGLMATGDETVRSTVMDIARELDWPERYTARVLENDFTRRWHTDIEGLKAQIGSGAESEAARWREAWREGDTRIANTFIGEAAGLIHERENAADILHRTVRDAAALLEKGARRVGT